MRIIVVRHAKAEDGAGDDAARRLTKEGREQAEALGKVLAATLPPPDEIWTSPLARAKETAELMIRAMGRPEPPKIVKDLEPGADPEHLAFLCAKAGRERVVLVGHAPDLGRFCSHLLGFQSEHHLKKGAVCIVDIDNPMAPPGRTVATLEPKQYGGILRGETYVPWSKTRLLA
jgi:phosphohistidine phosphatase